MRQADAMIFMKVGEHAGESFESILQRKQEEYRKAGCIFWGYGGTACHPITQVRPFVRSVVQQNGSVYLYMQPINSKANPQLVPATEYSIDGTTWTAIPQGITVTGSRYALVLDEICPGDLDFPMNEYQVGIGPSSGKYAEDYLKGRIDKACLVKAEEPSYFSEKIAKVTFTAKLLDPYAVMVR